MAYSLGERFPRPAKSFKLLEPGAYQNTHPPLLRLNKVPFLSKSKLDSVVGAKIWTHALYNVDVRAKIPNCTALMSTVPRFPYEPISKEDIERLICQCGTENPCECPVEEDKEEIICQGKVKKKLFKGLGLKSTTVGESSFSKIRKRRQVSPPFYDSTVIESTAFYRGCKWSKWTSLRDKKNLEVAPGPASYTIEPEPTYEKLCAEKLRSSKRKYSKQYRFIEMVQRRNLTEKRPGPADYTPHTPRGTELKWLGGKSERFTTNKYELSPGPTAHNIKRDFDKIEPPDKFSHAKLPTPAFFGVKAARFKSRREEGPSPASYEVYYRPSQSNYCNVAPFGSSSERFKEQIIKEEDEDDDENTGNDSLHKCTTKELPTWGFRSKTIRMKPLLKKINEASPADLAQQNIKISRAFQLQKKSPFFTSEGRFQPWYNWIPVYGKERTPGPAYYCLEKPKCLPAVHCGPTYRSPRFLAKDIEKPAPNAYKIGGGIETILSTHNKKLKDNIASKHQFHWEPPLEPKKMSLDMLENVLLKKSIAVLEMQDNVFNEVENKESVKKKTTPKTITEESKLLRCFMQSRQIPTYF